MVLARPFHFDGHFGWLHLPAAPVSDLGVVLCNPLGNEEICSHREWRILAETLAARGLPTLRFDYLGTGDSEGEGGDLALWRASVRGAMRALREEAGVGRIALCGLRLGAALALQAAREEGGVAGLALLAPPVPGRQLTREWRAAAAASPVAPYDPPMGADGSLNATGHVWPAALLREIEAIDLTAPGPAPAPAALLLGRPHDRGAEALAKALRAGGCRVEEHAFLGFDALMHEPLFLAAPDDAFARVADFLHGLAGPDTPGRKTPVFQAGLAGEGWRETPLRPDGHVFGMLCQPAATRAGAPLVLMLHTGTSHHIGNGRMLVRVARALAAEGVPSLRLDVSGLGDAPARPDDGEGPLYGRHNLHDVRAALDALRAMGAPGWNKVLATGICAGAYLAMRIAQDDARVSGLLAVNLQSFRWLPGAPLALAIRRNKRTLLSYLRSARTWGAWRRVARGEGDLPGIARAMLRRQAEWLWRRMRDLRPPMAGTLRFEIRGEIAAMLRRGTRAWFFWSDDDPGLTALEDGFGRHGRGLRALGAQIQVARGVDHNMNGRADRALFLELLRRCAARMTP